MARHQEISFAMLWPSRTGTDMRGIFWGDVRADYRTGEELELARNAMLSCPAVNPKTLHVAVEILVGVVKGQDDILLTEFESGSKDLDRLAIFPVHLSGRNPFHRQVNGVSPTAHRLKNGYSPPPHEEDHRYNENPKDTAPCKPGPMHDPQRYQAS